MDIRAMMPYLRLLWPLSPSPHIPKVGPSEPTSNLENSCHSRGGRAWPDSTPTPQELWDGPYPHPTLLLCTMHLSRALCPLLG